MSGIPYNRTNIISNALLLIGLPAITSIASGGEAAVTANQLYDMLLAKELSNPNWHFATTVKTLSKLAGVDPNYRGYHAAYQKPSGCLAIWQIWPRTRYEIFGDRIWTNGGNETIQCEFRELTVESKMPPVFLNYFTYVMAYNLGIILSESENMLSRVQEQMNKSHAIAMTVNSQEQPNQAFLTGSWLTVRHDDGYGRY